MKIQGFILFAVIAAFPFLTHAKEDEPCLRQEDFTKVKIYGCLSQDFNYYEDGKAHLGHFVDIDLGGVVLSQGDAFRPLRIHKYILITSEGEAKALKKNPENEKDSEFKCFFFSLGIGTPQMGGLLSPDRIHYFKNYEIKDGKLITHLQANDPFLGKVSLSEEGNCEGKISIKTDYLDFHEAGNLCTKEWIRTHVKLPPAMLEQALKMDRMPSKISLDKDEAGFYYVCQMKDILHDGACPKYEYNTVFFRINALRNSEPRNILIRTRQEHYCESQYSEEGNLRW